MKIYCPYLLISLLIATCLPVQSQIIPADSLRWWPELPRPAGVVHLDAARLEAVTLRDGSQSTGPMLNLVSSLSGLAAQALASGRGDELVWIDFHHGEYARWYAGARERLAWEDRGTLEAWELLRRGIERGWVKGYVLYSADLSTGAWHSNRSGMERSLNVATTAAGVLGGLLVSEELEARVAALGLPQLLDARGKSEKWALDTYKEQLSRTMGLAQEPRTHHLRDYAIAHRLFSYFTTGEAATAFYAWLEPKSTLIGWNLGDEGTFVGQMSNYGHIVVASNWCLNLPLLSAGARGWQPPARCETLDPRTIAFDDTSQVFAFVLTDGDNLQWQMGDFFSHPYYWANPDLARFSFNFGTCLADMYQAAPDVLVHLQQSQPRQSSVILHGGGYFYPDYFGIRRTDVTRETLLRRHARQLSHYMEQSGSTVLMFICQSPLGSNARLAYKVFAREIRGLTGMLVMQYSPYEGGNGQVFWYPNADGYDIPVVCAKYSIWANLNTAGAGTPAKVARLVNDLSSSQRQLNAPYYGWIDVHSWSGFQYQPGDDEQAENGQFLPPGQGMEAGVTPALWCANRFTPGIKVVSAEEMLWRLRMHARPEQTRAWLASLSAIRPEVQPPQGWRLQPAYPNPFNADTTILFEIDRSGPVTLTVHNVRGERLATLVDDELTPGSYRRTWAARSCASGLYLLRLQQGERVQTQKALLIR